MKEIKYIGRRMDIALAEMQEVQAALAKLIKSMEKSAPYMDISYFLNKARLSWKKQMFPAHYFAFRRILERPEDDPMF